MNFSQALNHLKVDSGKVARDNWNGKGMWITISPGTANIDPKTIWSDNIREYVEQASETVSFRPYIMMKTVDGDFVPWVASQTDLLAEDWFPVD